VKGRSKAGTTAKGNRKGQRATAKGLPLHLIIVGAILYGCPSFMVAHPLWLPIDFILKRCAQHEFLKTDFVAIVGAIEFNYRYELITALHSFNKIIKSLFFISLIN